MMSLFKRLAKEEEGQGMVEYGLIIALVSVVAIVALATVGDNLNDIFDDIADYISGTEEPT